MMETVRNRFYGSVGDPDQARLIAIEAKAAQAFASNNTYLGLASPSAAQTTTQVQRLTREVNGLLRLLLGDFTSDDS
jgi:hypothetical protein